MKKSIIALFVGSLPMLAMAQGATDAYQLAQPDLKGTARYMSMAGAFGALGGDLSTLNQNPAGIGVYRSSELGLSLNLDFQSTKSNSLGVTEKASQTKFACNNFGYIGAVKLDNETMPYFQWGVSYSRVASFDRVYSGYVPALNTSLSNYVANITNGGNWTPYELIQEPGYNPYQESNAPWLSILAYNSYLINPRGDSNIFDGMFQNGTYGDATFKVREKGYIDEYAIDFGGNIMNTLYWGIGFGITDINFTSDAYYDEELTDARITNPEADGTTIGNGYFGLGNYQSVRGNGFNFKAGVIVKPINELRIGLAVHTPTYYDLRHEAYAVCDYSLNSGYEGYHEADEGYISYYDSDIRTPWRLIASAAGVIGGRGILSFDYEYVGYNDMRVSDADGYEYEDVTGDIKNYYQASHIIRIGGEYRVTPQFSVRAGYSCQTQPAKDNAIDNRDYIYTSGTNPAYTFDETTQYITAGLGYRTGGFYIDMAYVNKARKSVYRAFSSFDAMESPTATLKDNNNQLVFSLGYKF